MRIAVYALSKRGVRLAADLQDLDWAGVELELECFAHQKWFHPNGDFNWHNHQFKHVFAENFDKYDAHICIMALGIVVRELAPLVRNKTVDPAVVVIDELGQFAISVIAGHLGGANILAEEVAMRIGAQPVITTASDGLRRLTPDSYGPLRGWKIENPEGLIAVNSAIVNDQELYLYVGEDLSAPVSWGDAYQISHGDKTLDFGAVHPLDKWPGLEPAVIVSNRVISVCTSQVVVLRPNNLVVGVGCKRGTSSQTILEAIHHVFREFGFSMASLCCLGSIDLKSDETGLLKASRELQVEALFVSREAIAQSGLDYKHSDFVKKTVGVGGVCEPVAMILAQTKELLVPRQVMSGITIAVAQKHTKI